MAAATRISSSEVHALNIGTLAKVSSRYFSSSAPDHVASAGAGPFDCARSAIGCTAYAVHGGTRKSSDARTTSTRTRQSANTSRLSWRKKLWSCPFISSLALYFVWVVPSGRSSSV